MYTRTSTRNSTALSANHSVTIHSDACESPEERRILNVSNVSNATREECRRILNVFEAPPTAIIRKIKVPPFPAESKVSVANGHESIEKGRRRNGERIKKINRGKLKGDRFNHYIAIF